MKALSGLKKVMALVLMLWGYSILSQAQVVHDSVTVHFHIGDATLVLDHHSNQSSLKRIEDKLQHDYNDSIYWKLRKVEVIGYASPEGPIRLNKKLSAERAEALFNYLSTFCTIPDTIKTSRMVDTDWASVIAMAEADSSLPHREEVLPLLHEIARNATIDGWLRLTSINRLKKLAGGDSYAYIARKYFPALRRSEVHLWYTQTLLSSIADTTLLKQVASVPLAPLQRPQPAAPSRSLNIALKTNLLYDVALVPNLGVEIALGKNWSIGAGGMYAWWKKGVDRRWCIAGADLSVRRWFGSQTEAKPLTGHHLGIHAQTFMYDFCLDDKGYMGGNPGKGFGEKLSYTIGLEYGYSLPVARRLNLDFGLSLGYFGGKYHEYRVIDDCKVWQSTQNRHWWGPTKAEVSLVWLLSPSKSNKKGGSR